MTVLADTARLIELAEESARTDQEDLIRELEALAARASEHADRCRPLHSLRGDAMRLKNTVQTAVEGLRRPGAEVAAVPDAQSDEEAP